MELTAVNRLDEIAALVITEVKNTKNNIIRIGQWLLEAKGLIPHGKFMDWVEEKFSAQLGWGLDSAERFMAVAEHPQLASYPFGASTLYLLAGAPPDAAETLLEMNEAGEETTYAIAVQVVAQSKFQAKVESIVAALEGAAPSEQDLVEATAMKTLAEIQHGFDNPNLRDMAHSLYDRYGARLNELARVVDNDMSNTNNPNYIPAGNGNGTHIWTSLEEGKRNTQEVVVHLPTGDPLRKYDNFVIAILPNIDDMHIIPIQCQFLSSGAKGIGLVVPNLTGGE